MKKKDKTPEFGGVREIVDQIQCPSCSGGPGHWIDVYKEDGKYYTLCIGVDIAPYQLTERDLKYWNIKH